LFLEIFSERLFTISQSITFANSWLTRFWEISKLMTLLTLGFFSHLSVIDLFLITKEIRQFSQNAQMKNDSSFQANLEEWLKCSRKNKNPALNLKLYHQQTVQFS